MQQVELLINRILRGGIYFLKLPKDEKMRPYVVVSKENGYGMDVLVLAISSKYATSEAALPILLMGKISFVRTSSVIEVSSKELIHAEFLGIVQDDILDCIVTMFTERILSNAEEMKTRTTLFREEYLELLEGKKYVLHADEKILFTKDAFLENRIPGIAKHVEKEKPKKKKPRYPFNLSEWSTRSLKAFRTDQFKLPENALMSKYDTESKDRINFLKVAVKEEIQRRREENDGTT